MSAVFVGRQGVLEGLGAKLGDAFAGRGSVAMLAGEPGIGKTAVARAFASLAEGRGATVLSGSCFEGGWQPAYAPWVEALGAYAAAADPVGLSRLLGASGPPLAQLVPALSSALPGPPPPAPLPPDEARFRLYDAVARLLARVAAQTPALLVLDDLHWADRDTLGLLRYVARASTRSSLLILGRTGTPLPATTANSSRPSCSQWCAARLTSCASASAGSPSATWRSTWRRWAARRCPGSSRRRSTKRRPATPSTSARSSTGWWRRASSSAARTGGRPTSRSTSSASRPACARSSPGASRASPRRAGRCWGSRAPSTAALSSRSSLP